MGDWMSGSKIELDCRAELEQVYRHLINIADQVDGQRLNPVDAVQLRLEALCHARDTLVEIIRCDLEPADYDDD